MKQFYVYLHLKPNGEPFYVGKGTFRRSNLFSVRNPHHKNIVAKYGKENIEVMRFPRDTEASALADEIAWIKVLRESGFVLTNMTDGGDGVSGWIPSESEIERRRNISTETRNKIAKAHIGNTYRLGMKASAETLAKMSASRKGKPTKRRGCKFTQEHCAKLSAAKKGKATWNKGKKLSDEHCNNLSISHLGNKPSSETLLKKSAALKDKPWSAARRAAQEAKNAL